MAHRFAGYSRLGTAFDYGRTDWYDDFYDIDYYAWGPFTWAMQWQVLKPSGNKCLPHGRMTLSELNYGADKIFNLSDSEDKIAGLMIDRRGEVSSVSASLEDGEIAVRAD